MGKGRRRAHFPRERELNFGEVKRGKVLPLKWGGRRKNLAWAGERGDPIP